ncbi:hypothetical protein HPP92_001465 [Vanilla planifolia]|uniref:Uncharacterized protein n=1 Tax=Vanilla planifolia TaxID=51239 RepID=A0A835SCR8_VANPL|nr:hypothetical protein HPP92_001465 [Vanilla planifolia]
MGSLLGDLPPLILTISVNCVLPIQQLSLRNSLQQRIVLLITGLFRHQIKLRSKRAATEHLTPEHGSKQPRGASAEEQS